VSLTTIVTVIGWFREVTGFGLKVTVFTISRSPFGTSATSTDLPPPGSSTIPPAPPPASVTTAVCAEIAVDLPRLFFPVTLIRTVEPTSPGTSL
jgi:hypothetical protein